MLVRGRSTVSNATNTRSNEATRSSGSNLSAPEQQKQHDMTYSFASSK